MEDVVEHARYVAVVGPGHADDRELDQAFAVGRGLAEAGCTVVCGGLGGVMEAACAGAAEVGGTSLGLLPGGNRAAANPHVTVAVATGLGELRNGLIVRTSDALVAVGGAYGTLSEVALALKLGVPVIGLHTWELTRGGTVDVGIVRVDHPEQAVAQAVELARR